ncbi:unnamed protein product [Orchesella dallaii]|uniref:C2H2-type domain-containing protein n=1 Tax=Orchesella dallaii TaxID=48710 RepID=A0ABP1RVL4_9HEXA
MKRRSNYCIFCANECPPTFKICNGQLVQLEKDQEDDSKKFISSSSSGPDSQDNWNLEAHLKAVFIVRKILNIGEATCANFLGNFDGQLDPQFWFSVCPSCETLVKEFWEKLREIGKLERRTQAIRAELKGLIVNSQEGTHAGGRRKGGVVWKEIREKAVEGVEILSEGDGERNFVKEDENMNDEDSDSDFDLEENGDDWENSRSDSDSEGGNNEQSNKNEEVNDNDSSPSPPPPPPKRKRYYFKCDECGDLSCNMTRFHQHQKLHNLGTGVICPDCGWLCQKLSPHVAHWHPAVGERSKINIEDRMSQRIMKHVKKPEDEDKEELEALQKAYKIIRKAGSARYFQCTLCPATNSHLKRMQLHLTGHAKGNNAIPCEVCSWIVEPEKMQFHIAKMHRRQPKNPKGNVKKEMKQKQKQNRLRRYRYKCDDCTGDYRSVTELQEHKKLHSSGKGVTCSECGWLVENLGQHKGRKHPQSSKRKQNDNGGLATGKKEESASVVVVSEELPYYCDHCHMIFPMLHKLHQHLRSFHASHPLLTCSLCQATLETKQLLQLHMKGIHEGQGDFEMDEETEPPQPQQCPHCSIEFESKTKKDFHIAKEHQDRLLSCLTCSLSFKTFSDYRKHMETTQAHGNEKRFSCELCGKAYTESWALKCHRQQEHYEVLGLEPNRCEHCGKVFGNKGSLDYHIRAIHTKQWKFTCEFCGKGFHLRHRMVEHALRKHKTEG